MVAHAAGSLESAQPNTLAAFLSSIKAGHRFIELDFSWTSDRALVAIHDWDASWSAFGGGGVPVVAEFEEVLGEGALTVARVCEILRGNPQVSLVTDVKHQRADALSVLAKACGTDRMVVQVHSRDEYDWARSLGFRSIILTLYANRWSSEALGQFLDERQVVAVALSDRRFDRFSDVIADRGGATCFMVHTINDERRFEELMRRGACGVYSDVLRPNLTQTDSQLVFVN